MHAALLLVLALAATSAPKALAGFIAGYSCQTANDCPMRLPCVNGGCYIYDKTYPSPTPTATPSPSPTPTPTATPTPTPTPSSTGTAADLTPPATPDPSATQLGTTPVNPHASPDVPSGDTSVGSGTVSDRTGLDTSVTGDPQFIGLDGRLFFFDGLPDKVFNLLSEQNHQLNARFVAGPHKTSGTGAEIQGTWLGAFGLKAYKTVLLIEVDESGYMTVDLNGEKITQEQLQSADFAKSLELENNVLVVIEEYREDLGQAVTVITPLFEFLFFPTIRQWDPEINQTARGHLNLAMSCEPDAMQSSQMHGVLGQTTLDRAPVSSSIPPELQRAFLGEGQQEDYMVSGLLTDDFKFNQYKPSASQQVAAGLSTSKGHLKSSASRRLSKADTSSGSWPLRSRLWASVLS